MPFDYYPAEYSNAGSGMTEIQYWDVLDERFHSYLVEGGFLLDELVGEVSKILEDLPPQAKVFITSGDPNRLLDMIHGIEEYIIPHIEFVTPTEVMNGLLRGRQGVLMITDTWLMTEYVKDRMYFEQTALKCYLVEEEDEELPCLM